MRPEILFPLIGGIESLKGVGERSAKLLAELIGGNKILDLLWHLPSNLIDRRYAPRLAHAAPGRICTVKIKVLEHLPPQTSRQPYKITATDGTAEIT